MRDPQTRQRGGEKKYVHEAMPTASETMKLRLEKTSRGETPGRTWRRQGRSQGPRASTHIPPVSAKNASPRPLHFPELCLQQTILQDEVISPPKDRLVSTCYKISVLLSCNATRGMCGHPPRALFVTLVGPGSGGV